MPFHLRIDGNDAALERDGAAEPRRPEPAAVAGLADAAGGAGRAGDGVRAGDRRRRDRRVGPARARDPAARRRSQHDLEHTRDATARTALEGRIAELQVAVANPNDRRVLVRNFVERFGFEMTGEAVVEGVEGLDTTAPWRIDFWLGGWDPDLLSLYMKGALNVPYAD